MIHYLPNNSNTFLLERRLMSFSTNPSIICSIIFHRLRKKSLFSLVRFYFSRFNVVTWHCLIQFVRLRHSHNNKSNKNGSVVRLPEKRT